MKIVTKLEKVIYDAIVEAIETMGLENFKKTSFFMSNYNKDDANS